MTKKTISIVIPIFNEADNLGHLLSELEAVAQKITEDFDFDIGFVFIDDGSTDDSFDILKAYDFGTRTTRLLRFSRNFGKEAALTAGIKAAEDADAAILMDADLQHPPELIHEFIRIWQTENADSVYAYKASRRNSEGILKAALSRIFFWLINRDLRYEITPGAGDFRLVNQQVMKALLSLPESDRFMKGLYGWVGFKQIGLPFTPLPRVRGKSHHNMLKLLSMTIAAITSFSTAPLRLTALVGIVLALSSFIYGFYIVIEYFFFPGVPDGVASILTLIAFFGGIQLMFLGILGEYIGKSVLEAKKRPIYIMAEEIHRGDNLSADRR